MNELDDIKSLFNEVLGVEIELDGKILSEAEREKINFISFVDCYRQAVIRSNKIDEKFGINLWAYEDLFAKSLESLINLAFTDEISELILWYIYEHPLAESNEDRTVNDTSGNQYIVHNTEDLYDLIIKLQEE